MPVYIKTGKYQCCNKCKMELDLCYFYIRHDISHGRPTTRKTCRDCIAKSKGHKGSIFTRYQESIDLYNQGLSKCRTCKEIQALEEFPRNGVGITGRHTECRTCRSKKWYANRIKYKSYLAKNRFGLSHEDFYKHLRECNNSCEICFTPFGENDSSFHVDHDHDTGNFRGFLCAKCNQGIGSLKDSSVILASAHEYLVKHGK